MKTCARPLSALFGVAVLAMSPIVASAGTGTGSLLVSATVLNSCTVTATPLVFATYTVTNTTAAQTQAEVDTICTVGDKVTISMGTGANSSTVAGRQMAFSGSYLPYQIYTDSGYSNIWGDGVNGGSHTVSTTGTGIVNVTPVYGQIPVNQNVPAGAYTDTVVVTISY